MKKTNKKTEEQILDSIVDLYLEKNPREAQYAVNMTSSEDDSEATYYYPLTEDEKELIRGYEKGKDCYCCLEEYLEETEEGKQLLQKLEIPDTLLPINTIDSCDLEDVRYFTEIKIIVPDEEKQKANIVYRYHTETNMQDFRRLMKMHINRKNHVSVNMLTYLFPGFTTSMMERIVNSLYDGIVEFDYPFTVDLTEIRDAVENIMNPMKDELALFTSSVGDIREYVEKHAIVPGWMDLYEEKSENDCFQVYASFCGNKLCIEQERITFLDFLNSEWSEEDEQSFDANLLCKHLGLNDYDELINYMKDHYPTKTAINDIRAFVDANCPAAIIKK